MKDYIGKLVKKFESGSKGCTALSHCGNDWGLSCGTYQLTLRWGNCINFLKKYYPAESKNLYFNNKGDLIQGTWPGAEYCSSPDEVKSVWMTCYNKDTAAFEQNEYEHIKATYYDNVLKRLEGIYKPTNRAMQECLWSWGIHKGVSSAVTGMKTVIQRVGVTASVETIFDACYDYRYSVNNFTRYSNSSSSERETLRPYLDVAIFDEDNTSNSTSESDSAVEGTNKIVIGLNAGHTVSGPGHGAVGTIKESEHTRAVVSALIPMLEEMGVTVVPCTVDSASTQGAYLDKVVSMANNQDLDWFVSIHFNAGGGEGVEAYTYKGKQYPDALEVCENIAALGFKNRGVKEGSGLYVIRKTKAKALLIEVCFVDSADANKYLNLGSEKIAQAIAAALADYVASDESDKVIVPIPTTIHRVQVGAFTHKANATALINKLKSDGFASCIKKANDMYKVQVGAYSNKNNAIAMKDKLIKAGYEAIITN